MISRAKMRRHAPTVVLFLLILSLLLVACERPLGDGGEADVEATTAPTTDPDQGGGIEAEATQPVETAPESETEEPVTETEEPGAETEGPVAEEEGEEESAIPSDDPEEAITPEETAEETEEAAEEVVEEGEEAAEEVAEEAEEAVAEGEEAAEEMAEEAEEAAEETTEATAEETAEEAAQTTDTGEQTHIVQPGENLYRIGLQYGISWVVLADYNNLPSGHRIYAGQELKIPGDPDAGAGGTPDETPETYVVRPGDNLYRIGAAFNIDWREIATANNIINPSLIYVGQVLTLPGGVTPPAEGITHTVRAGETLFTISLHYGVAWTSIAEANDIDAPYIIYPGEQLTIPTNS